MASADCRQFYRRQGEAARPFTDAASAGVDVASGWTPGGQRQLAGSVHDSRVPSGATPACCRFGENSQFISQTRQRRPFFIRHISPQQQAVNQKSVQHRHSAQTFNDVIRKACVQKNPDRPSAIFSLPAIQTAQGQVQFIGNTPHLFTRFVAGLHSAHGLLPDLCADPFHGRGGFPYPVYGRRSGG